MTTLITGATGFVGSAVARKLLDNGHKLRALVRPAGNRENLEGLAIETVEGDLLDPQSLQRACRDCDALFHVAADYRIWARHPQQLYENNVTGTRFIMEAAARAGIARIVYTSSVATLGLNSDGTPSTESTPATAEQMIGHYKRSKYLAEQQVQRFADAGLPVVIVNPSTPVGPRDIKPTPTGHLLAEAAAGHIPAFVNTGLNIVHVDDVAGGHVLAFERGRVGERYILGGENLSLQAILAQVATLCGRRPPRIRLPRQLVYPLAWLAQTRAAWCNGPEPLTTIDGLRMSAKWMYFSSDKARRELGYRSRPAAQAISDAVQWFRQRH